MSEPTFKRYTVEVLIDGLPVALVDVPTAGGAEAACRRAKLAYAARHAPSTNLRDITVNIYDEANP